jgi:hypothetical protein
MRPRGCWRSWVTAPTGMICHVHAVIRPGAGTGRLPVPAQGPPSRADSQAAASPWGRVFAVLAVTGILLGCASAAASGTTISSTPSA